MGRGEDRISYLPDPVLQNILAMMPLKSAIRTDVLSKKWRNLWQHSLSVATALDFDESLACHLSAKEFVATVNRYLSLNKCQKLERFHAFFCPFDMFAHDMERWVSYAVGKGVSHLDFDLSQGFRDLKNGEFTDERSPFELPSSLFGCDSLTDLSLSRCDFSTPLNLSNFGGLRSLSLAYSSIEGDMLQSILAECSLLESLALRSCPRLFVISITHPDLRLKRLTIGDCWLTDLLEISAPKLQSFHYFGELCRETNFLNISSLKDASIYSISRYSIHDYMEMLMDLSDVQILTLCTATVLNFFEVERYNAGEFPIELQNLKELQLLVTSMVSEFLTCIFSFFSLCTFPSLEKLFFKLPNFVEDPNERKHGFAVMLQLDQHDNDARLDHVKVIKVTNFKGSINDMRLVSFLLEKAIVLETMVLVLPLAEKGGGQESFFLRVLRGQVLLLSKASPFAEIVIHESWEDDGLNPTHVEIYNDYSCLPPIPCNVGFGSSAGLRVRDLGVGF